MIKKFQKRKGKEEKRRNTNLDVNVGEKVVRGTRKPNHVESLAVKPRRCGSSMTTLSKVRVARAM